MARYFQVVAWFFTLMIYPSAAVHLRLSNASNEVSPSAEASSHAPIMMFAHGCSMTTTGINMVGSLLNAHGVATADTGCGEMMKSLEKYTDKKELKARMGAFGREDKLIDKVLSYPQNQLVDKFRVVYDWANSQGKTLFWKMEMPTAKPHPLLGSFLKSVGTKAFLYLRTNLIDVLHCRVHDFCDKPENFELGITVDSTGNHTSCGFRGRETAIAGVSIEKEEDVKQSEKKVKLYPKNVISRLNAAAGGDDIHQEYLKQFGFNSQVRSAEELFAFEYAAGPYSPEFKKSVRAWKDLIASLGITPKNELIEKALVDYGTFTPPQKHSEKIYNFDEIEQVLKGTKYHKMLRM